MKIVPCGDCALNVILDETHPGVIDPYLNRRVHALARAVRYASLPGVGEAVPGYNTLLVYYDPLLTSSGSLEAHLRALLDETEGISHTLRRIVIPVEYGGEQGPDLEFVARYARLSEDEVIQIHSSGMYPVYMMGFTPGFPYLGGLDARIAAPRLETPRLKVPGGSVGIAGVQTGVYPSDSPGGWRIIGWTAARLFDPTRADPCLVTPGDIVKFKRI